MSEPTVEVVIPHAVGTERLERALGDLARQVVPHRVCVVDNDAPPASAQLARRSGARVVEMGENAGFARAVNAGVSTSEATLVVLLNDDCRPDAGFLASIVAAFEETGAAMIAAILLDPAGRIDSAGVEVDRSLLAYDFLHGRPYDPARPPESPPLGPSGGAAGYRRDALAAVGGFDERFFAYLEDVDVALRMRGAGHECALAWDATAFHDHSATLGSGSVAKNRLMGESRGRLLAKWRPALTWRERVRGALVDSLTYGGKLLVDRNLSAISGRIAVRGEDRPKVAADALDGMPFCEIPVGEALRRRVARRI